ncbi:hypothetical protein O1611_g7947 [Lasiodiplodia mahajangana]|uniref:Uncharacterized protein n=1 Tax=Lasiodiplodia mahajangana TaxID=1108764 RepID=A0ACC2JDZ6_9PEZI|nr:hypothetical protein O1611_g7947 [Lasiodiplodia mahajangana]
MLLAAVTSPGGGTELSQSPEDQSPVGRDSPNDVLLQSAKRSLDATFDIDSLPAKRARLTRTDGQQPGVENGKLEQATDTILQQPKPKPSTQPYALFLKDFIDPVSSHSRPEYVYTSVSEWLESVGSDREKRCRSDSYLDHGDDGPILRENTRSAPEMAYTRDADGFVTPPMPPSVRSFSEVSVGKGSDISGRSSAKSLVEDVFYRSRNLAVNGIYLRNVDEGFPGNVARLVRHVGGERSSPGPPLDRVCHDAELHRLENGAEESDVEEYFRTHLYPYPKSTESLKRSDKQPMFRHIVPGSRSNPRVSNPIPDMLYGYTNEAFPQQQTQLISMGTEMSANNQGLLYPFFTIEFKGDGPGGTGSLWVATNQCLGSSASCINVAERLNRRLKYCKSDKIQPINNVVFSVAMNGTEARLYISWKPNELDYYTRKIDSFMLQKPRDYLEFRKYVRNIIDWGKGKRLNEIRDSLNILLEESRKASEAAKARPPPSVSSSTSSSKRHKNSGNSDSA